MAKMGRLTSDRFGFSMPVDAPLYSNPPYYYRDVEALGFNYETEEEAALDSLPQGLELVLPPTAIVFMASYHFSTLGPYNEAIQMLLCLFEGRIGAYVTKILVDSDVALAVGREIYGYPKKLAHIELSMEGETIMGTVERPAGNRLCTGIVKPEVPLDPSQLPSFPTFTVRAIPHPEEGHQPSLLELIEVMLPFRYSQVWQGPASLQYNSVSPVEPWHKLPVKQVNAAFYSRMEFELPFGKVIKTYRRRR